jgi:Phage-related minor tail protein/Lambda phage tail tape-measure protein (Tape_meas_lam_C)
MANTLGTVSVDLVANTASFVTGLATASSAAKKAGGEITESFSRIGEFAGSALAPFGEIGRVIGEAFGQIGLLGGSAAQSLAKMGGGMSALAIGGGVAIGALAAIEAASIGLTIHTAEAAARMLVMSQTTGVSVEALSGLAFVAKQSGVEAEVMENGLTKLNKAIFAAGTAAPGTVNAFTRLHIAVRDSNGEFRDTQDVFRDIAEKFAGMEDGPVKGALAIQLFGRAGAALIPILNQGKDGIDEFIKTAQALGIVLDTETAEAAHKFEQSLNTIKAAGDGVSLQLTKALLPALQQVASALTEGLKDKSSGFTLFIEGIATLTKGTIAVLETFWTGLEQIGLAFRHAGADVLIFSDQISAMWSALKSGDFSGISRAYAAAGQAQRDNARLFNEESKKLWKDNSNFIENVTGPRAPFTLEHKRGGAKTDVDTKPEKDDTILERIKERIAALAKEAAGWLKIGEAGSQAEQLIAEAQKKGTDEFEKLRDLANKEKNPARRSAALSFVDSNQGLIEGAEAAAVYGSAIKGVVSELDKQHLKLQEEVSATEALTSAWGTGGAAAAIISAHFADQAAKVRVLKETHDLLAAKLGEENAEVRQLADGYALAAKELSANEASFAAKVHADLNLEIKKTTTAFDDELPALRAIAAAYFDTAAAARAAQVELKVAQFKAANPLADEGLVNRQRDLEKRRSDESFRNSITEQASKFDLTQSYNLEIEKLSELREKLQEYGRSTLLVDAAVYDANNKMIQQWDAAVAKVGTFSQRFKGLMNELALEGQNFSGKVFESFHKAIDDMETQLTKLVVTGKANFKEILQGMEESIVKAGIQKGIGAIAGAIGLNIPGLGAKADGSSNNPFYVKIADGGLGGLIGGGGSNAEPNGGFLSGLFSGGGSSGGGFFSNLLGGLGGLFGGFLEGGGDVTPGKAYVVGEKHPEFFVPKQAGQVASSLKMGGDTNHTSIVHMHLHGVTDADSFRRSGPQIMAQLHRVNALAYARNS